MHSHMQRQPSLSAVVDATQTRGGCSPFVAAAHMRRALAAGPRLEAPPFITAAGGERSLPQPGFVQCKAAALALALAERLLHLLRGSYHRRWQPSTAAGYTPRSTRTNKPLVRRLPESAPWLHREDAARA